jgi:hypothetical protein
MLTFFQKKPRLRNWWISDLPIAVLLAALLVIGIRLVTSYGESWDEPYRIDYARSSLQAYIGGESNLPDEKGPFFGMVAYLGANALIKVVPGWRLIDGWHFMTYLAYLMGLYFFYRLCRRLMDPAPALAAALLFATQPVIWGHAFFNPKDIPFMSFFLASVFLGLNMVDHFPQADAFSSRLYISDGSLRRDWEAAPRRLKVWLAGLAIAWIALTLAISLGLSEIARLMEWIYNAPPSSLISQIFLKFAPEAHQFLAEGYILKAQYLALYLALAAWLVLAAAIWFLAGKVFPARLRGLLNFQNQSVTSTAFWWRGLRQRVSAPDLRQANGVANPFSAWQWLKPATQPGVFAAACFLGFTSDIRTLGPAAGLLVAVYFLVKAGRRAIPTLLTYLGVAALVTYVFWPYLWQAPVSHYFDSMTLAADYNLSENAGPGEDASSAEVIPPPPDYLPNLISLQLTEPALSWIVIGFVVALLYLVGRHPFSLDVLLLMAWFAAPILFAIWHQSALYNNFRQFLFLIPPFFILAGLGLQVFWNILKGIHRPVVFGLAALLLLIPAVYWNAHLFPYEYVYYNSLAGNLQQAANTYETDYWVTSLKADFEFLNRDAPLNSTILIPSLNIVTIAQNYARLDLSFMLDVPLTEIKPEQNSVYAISIPCLAGNPGAISYPDAPTVYQVIQDDTVFSEVQKIH